MARAFGWEAPKLAASIALFLISGLLEIIGGWLVWRAMLGGGESGGGKQEAAIGPGNSSAPSTSSSSSPSWRGFPTPPRASPARLWLLLPGLACLVLYGFVPVLQTLFAPKSGEGQSQQSNAGGSLPSTEASSSFSPICGAGSQTGPGPTGVTPPGPAWRSQECWWRGSGRGGRGR